MKKKILPFSIALLFAIANLKAQTSRVMAIHNSPDTALSKVDVWLVTPGGSSKLIDDFEFRKSSGFIDAPAGVDIRIAFALSNSTSINDTLLGYGFNLTANQNYVLMATGTVNTGYTPARNFNLKVITPVQERITGGTQTQLTLVHASTDAPPVEIIIRRLNSMVADIENFEYDDVERATLPTQDYFIDIYANGDLVTTLQAPLKSLNLTDSALVVFASGFLNPANNNNGAPFGIFAALSNGLVVELPVKNTFRLQVVHACADPAASNVDIWLKNNADSTHTKILSNFAYKSATPFIDLPANTSLEVGIAPSGSTTPGDILFVEPIENIPGGYTAIAIASGVLDTAGFAPNPDGADIDFMIAGLLAPEQSLASGKVTVNLYHGVTDAPTVDVKLPSGLTIFREYSYGDASNGEDVIVDPENYVLEIHPKGSNSPLVSYRANLTGFADSALAVIATGFLNPAANKNGPAFGLIAVTPSGRVLELEAVATSVKEVTAAANQINIYPNPASESITFDDNTKADYITITDMQGKIVYEGVYQQKINISALKINPGLYIVTLSGADEVKTAKLMIN